MKATIPYIGQKFEEFNRLIFAGQLPEIPVRLSDAKTFLGKCCFRKRRKEDGGIVYYDFELRINTRIDLPESEIEDVIIHEMIHYFIAYKQLEDASSHGPIFRHMMNSINEKYHHHVTVRYKGTEEQAEELIDKKQHYHIVAVVVFADGRSAIKVLPRVIPSIVNYYNKMKEQKEIVAVQLFMSNDVYFNRFPTSSTLTAHYLDAAIIKEHLSGAEKMECDGKTVIRTKR